MLKFGSTGEYVQRAKKYINGTPPKSRKKGHPAIYKRAKPMWVTKIIKVWRHSAPFAD